MAFVPEHIAAEETVYFAKEIDGSGFSTCGLSALMICAGSEVAKIGVKAFEYCASLTEFYFEGTKAQWNKISKVDYWNGYMKQIRLIAAMATSTSAIATSVLMDSIAAIGAVDVALGRNRFSRTALFK